MTTAPTSTPGSFEGGLPPELWGLTASYAFVDIVSTGKGDLEKVPGFLRIGVEAALQRPVLELRGHELTGNQLRVLSTSMPHLREVDLQGAQVDGSACSLRHTIRRFCASRPNLKIVLSSTEELVKKHLLRDITHDTQAKRVEKTQLEAERLRLMRAEEGAAVNLRVEYARRLERLDQELMKVVAALHSMEGLLGEVEHWQSSSPAFQRVLQAMRCRDRFMQFADKEFATALIALIAPSSSQDEKRAAQAGLERAITDEAALRVDRDFMRAQVSLVKDEKNPGSWIYWYAKRCVQMLFPESMAEAAGADMLNACEQELIAAEKQGKISEAQHVTLSRVILEGPAALPQFLAAHRPRA